MTRSERIRDWQNRTELARRGLGLFSVANSSRLAQRLVRLNQDLVYNKQTPEKIPEDEPMEMRIGDQVEVRLPNGGGSVNSLLLAFAFTIAGVATTWALMKDNGKVQPSPEPPRPVINVPANDDNDTTYDVILE